MEFSDIFKNLQEFIGKENIEKCFENNKSVNVYWGTAPTGRPHVAYFLAMTKLADFLRSHCHVTVLFADLHAYLDNMKAPWSLLDKRTQYYEILIKGMLKALKVPLNKLRFVKGTDYQLEENYTRMVYSIISNTSFRDAEKAGCDVVKQNQDPLMSSIVYPLLQALDEEFLNVDVQFGGVDQRKIFIYAEKYLPNLNFSKRSHLMNPMIPGLTGGKMSASEENSKIDLLDSKADMEKKLDNANSVGKTPEENGVLAFIKYVLIPNKDLIDTNVLDEYSEYESFEKAFLDEKISMNKVKDILQTCLVKMTENLESEFTLSGNANLIDEAYPSEVEINENKLIKELSVCEYNIGDFPNCFSNLIKEFPHISKDIKDYPLIIDKPKILWSCRSTGEPHIGYLLPILKLAKLSNNGWKVVILIEDIGAMLHSKHELNRPKSLDVLSSRAQLYKLVLRECFVNFQGNEENLSISITSEYQYEKDFALNFYQSLSNITYTMSKAFVEWNLDNKDETLNRLSSLIYPALWCLDNMYHDATVRLVGSQINVTDAYKFTKKLADKLTVKDRIPFFVTHDLILSLTRESYMSSPKIGAPTAPKDKSSISLCHDIDSIKRNLKKAFFDPKQLEKDPSLNIIEKIIWEMMDVKEFHVDRTEENGGKRIYNDLETMKNELIGDLMHPGDIKDALVSHLGSILTRIRSVEGFKELYQEAYDNKEQRVKIGKKDFNPNNLDIKVATVKSVSYQTGLYTVEFKVGLDVFVKNKLNSMFGLCPGDKILLLTSPDVDEYKIGLFADQEGHIVKLEGKGQNVNVVFKHHNTVLPNLKLTNLDEAAKLIESNIKLEGRRVEWTKNNCQAIDLRLKKSDNKNCVKIHLI